ncbi:glycoside hydrolase family 26 protein [Benzoatithermus flavus]|uniref:Glycosyl hydrolase n=1 Tax=Benzoatithermus flavus TaxID=3108223 RepID=A0ABU8XR64_9PROT
MVRRGGQLGWRGHRRALALVSGLALATVAGATRAAPVNVPGLLDPLPATMTSPAAEGLLLGSESPAVARPTPTMVALTTTATSTAPVLRKAAWGGQRSGLPWASGASSGSSDLESWRGRRLDVRTGFLAIRQGWAELTQVSWLRDWVAAGGYPVVAVGLLPESARGQLAQCANGAFDAHIREIGRDLVAVGAGNAILRLGWEANRMGGFPWSITGDPGPYKGCFRRWVQVLRTVPGQLFTFDWNMGSRGSLPYHVDQAYPGAEYVDVIGVQYYDRCPPALTQADWDKRYNSYNTTTGSPYGLGKWLAYARSKGKRLSVPEWGIGGPTDACARPGVDNPLFVENMFRFFRVNAASIAYEAYFNGALPTGSHVIAPPDDNPLSWAKYNALWGRR